RREFLLRAVVLRITYEVTGHPVRHALEQVGSVSTPDPCNRVSASRMNHPQIIPVDSLCRHPVRRSEITDLSYRGVLIAARELGIAVVLADEQHRQFPQHREIESLVKRTGPGGAVTEEHDTDCVGSLGLSGPRGARRQGQISSYDTGSTQHAPCDINQVH